MAKPPSRTRALAEDSLFAAMKILQANGGSMSVKALMDAVAKRISFDDWALGRYNSGGVRWQVIMTFYSVDLMKAGFIVKKDGIWYQTPEGLAAMAKGAEAMLTEAAIAYRKWRQARDTASAESINEVVNLEVDAPSVITLEQIEQLAADGLVARLNQLNPYEFQDLAAALLRGMGYFTPFVAPPGKDGGVDIIAYRDPLGTVTPRMKVQVKHRNASANVQELRQLMGLLTKDGDVGVFISTGGFTSDALSTARASHVHMELIDQSRFLALWQQFYPKLNDEDKVRLPLHPVYFLDSES